MNIFGGVFRNLWRAIAGLFYETKEATASVVMMVFYKSTIEGSSAVGVDWLDFLIKVGMLIIIWYGVIKILVVIISKLLFGKVFELKIGLLDLLFKKLRPVIIQDTVQMTDRELGEKASTYAEKLRGVRKKITGDNTRRCCRLKNIKVILGKLLKKVNANKKTNAAIATIGAMAITGLAYIGKTRFGWEFIPILQEDLVTMLAMQGIATIGLVAPGVVGAGFQTQEQFEQAKKAKKQLKADKKEAKVEGRTPAPEKKAEKLSKKLGIGKEAALQIVKEQEAKRKEAVEKAAAAKEAIKVSKLAKKLNVSEEKAKDIRLEQLKTE